MRLKQLSVQYLWKIKKTVNITLQGNEILKSDIIKYGYEEKMNILIMVPINTCGTQPINILTLSIIFY